MEYRPTGGENTSRLSNGHMASPSGNKEGEGGVIREMPLENVSWFSNSMFYTDTRHEFQFPQCQGFIYVKSLLQVNKIRLFCCALHAVGRVTHGAPLSIIVVAFG